MRAAVLLALAMPLARSLPAQAQAQAQVPAPPVRTDTREQVPPAFLVAWKLSPAESRFAGGRTPAAGYRLFSYTADGKLLVDYWTRGADGQISAGNWTAAFDGGWQIEYTRAFGSTPYALVQLVKRDERTLDLRAMRSGKVFETGTFTVSPDGATMTFRYETAAGATQAVYHPWDLIN